MIGTAWPSTRNLGLTGAGKLRPRLRCFLCLHHISSGMQRCPHYLPDTQSVFFFSLFLSIHRKNAFRCPSLQRSGWCRVCPVVKFSCPLKLIHYFQPTPPHNTSLKQRQLSTSFRFWCQPNSNLPATFYLCLITDAETLRRCQTYLYHCHSSLLAQQSQMCIFPPCQKASCADKH